MRKLLVFQHVAFEPLGTLDAQFRTAGFRIRYVNFARPDAPVPDVRRYHGLVVLGGPMSLSQTDRYPHLAVEIDAIRTALDASMPVLGICLGAQLLAGALGGRVFANPVKEIGWYGITPTPHGTVDPLFCCFAGTEQIFQWHSDTFSLPHGAVHLAASAQCANQAFRFSDYAYGLQFHLEADEALIERWLRTPVHVRELRALGNAIDPLRIQAQTRRYIGRAQVLSREVFGSFIRRFYRRKRRIALPSR